MLEPNSLSGSLFYESLCFIFPFSSQVNRNNFENSSEMLICGVRYQPSWFPFTGKDFLYSRLNGKKDLVSD